MLSLEPSYANTTSSENSKVVEAQGKDVKTDFMKMIMVLKGKINKFLKEIKEWTIKIGRNQ